MSTATKIAVLDAAHGVAIWGRILVQVWRNVATAEAAAQMNQIALDLISADKSPASCLFVVEASSPPPGEGARKEFARFSREVVPRMGIAVVVAEGGGFRAAIVRGVVVTLTTLVPHKIPFKFVDNVQTATLTMQPHLGPRSGGPRALHQVVEDLRGRIGSQQIATHA